MISNKELEDRLHAEQTFFSQRLNMFFVAESMLIISFITSMNIKSTFDIGILLAYIGTIVTCMFFFVFLDNSIAIRKLATMVKKQTNYVGSSAHINFFFGITLPAIFIIVWAIFIYISYG